MRWLVAKVSFEKPNLTMLEWVDVAEAKSLQVWSFATK